MELDKSLFFTINEFNCEFRSLTKDDISVAYINGLNSDNGNIQLKPKKVTKLSQQKYVKNIITCGEKAICGLFINGTLVGTAGIQFGIPFFKYVQTQSDLITSFGIFIFLENFRNIGLGKTMVWASTYLIHQSIKELEFGAGMMKNNLPSLKSFLSCGFRNVFENDEVICVLLKYPELKKPGFIKKILIKNFSDSN